MAALVVAVVLGAGTGCKPKIGDACTTALECSSLGDRLCDTTQPGGYCTQFGCQPDGCPSEAACIVFRSSIDPACGTADDGKYGRFSQSFCMIVCESTTDCREGYACALPADRDALLLDQTKDNPASVKVCIAIATLTTPPSDPPGVCSPSTAPPLVPTSASSGVGGMGAGGMGAGGS
jgi:hypothetical protein